MSCQKEINSLEPSTNGKSLQVKNVTKSSNETFDIASIAMISRGFSYVDADESEVVTHIEMKNFDESEEIPDVIKLNGNEYSDNGEFFDLEARDGIFTRTLKIPFSDIINDQWGGNITTFYNPEFSYVSDLNDYVETLDEPTVSIGCKMRWADCPNTNWWNTSLFGEQCIELYDCNITFNF